MRDQKIRQTHSNARVFDCVPLEGPQKHTSNLSGQKMTTCGVELQKLFVRVWDVFLRCFRACRLPSHFSNRKFDTLWNFQSVISSARCAVNRCSKLDQICKLEMRQPQSRQCPFDLDFVHRKGLKERIRPQLQLPEVERNWLGRISEILQVYEMPSWDMGLLFSKQHTWQIGRVNRRPCQTGALSTDSADTTIPMSLASTLCVRRVP